MFFFCLLTFNSRPDIISRYNFNHVRFHGLMGYTSKTHEQKIAGPHQ